MQPFGKLFLIFLFISGHTVVNVRAKFEPREYTAAVVEFYPEQSPNLKPEERLRRNVDGYLTILQDIEKKNQNLDIVVFPESTLTTNAVIQNHEDYVPYTVEFDNSNDSLCTTQNPTYMTPLACAAQKSRVYMVINLLERERCVQTTKCSKDHWDFYNTNIVLDRNGALISKYRKYNLFGERFMNKTPTPDISIFDTDFGVRFGSFICFDILFKEPTLDLITKHNITSIIYPSMWFSELPFLTALQSQLQWAYGVNATLLASGANNPKVGSGGSGIFQGLDGALKYNILGNTKSKAFVSKIPGKTLSEETVEKIDKKGRLMDGFYFKKDNLRPYTSKTIKFGENDVKDSVCHKNFCCDFEIALQWSNEAQNKYYYTYHIVAFSGVRSFSGMYNGGVEICGVIACLGQTLDTCSKRFPNYDDVSWPVTFKRIQIKATFDVNNNKFQFPNSLLSNIKPLPVDAVEWKSTTADSKIARTYTLLKPQSRLMTFAIYGRDFSRDSPPSSN